MFLANIFDPGIVDNKGRDGYGSGFVFLERWGSGHWSTAESCQVCLEVVGGNASSLIEAGHAFSDFDIDISIRDKSKKKAVLLNDFLGDELDWELHVLVAFHGCVIVKLVDIKDSKLGIWSGDGAVEETFGGGQA